MGRMTKKIKDHAEELYNSDAYQDARDEEFNDQFRDSFIDRYDLLISITEDDIQGFLDSFTFPNEEDWCMNEAESVWGSYMDSKYEEVRDSK